MSSPQEILEDSLMSEFDMSYTEDDVLEEMFKEMSKEDIIEYVLEFQSDLTDTEDYTEFKEVMFKEYCEHR